MCNICGDPTSVWNSSGCSTCGCSPIAQQNNFTSLYSGLYNSIINSIGGKFWPGQGLPQAQYPPVDITQYSHYLDVLTSNIYVYNSTTATWSFLFSLTGAFISILQSNIIAGANITITPSSSGITIASSGGGGTTVVTPNTDTLQIVTNRGSSTNLPITVGGLTFQTLPNLYGDSNGVYDMVLDASTYTIAVRPRQQILVGPSGSTPPATGTFYRGDIYIAG